MSNGTSDIYANGVLATIDANGYDVTPHGKVGKWMPWGSGFKAEIPNEIFRVEKDEDGTERKVDVEKITESIEILWDIVWDGEHEKYPNALAHVYSYCDYLIIGHYDGKTWETFGVLQDTDLLISYYDRNALCVKWDDAYKHLPSLYILYPSESPTPGGEGEDMSKHLKLNCILGAHMSASDAASKEFDRMEKESGYKRQYGRGLHSDVNVQMLPGCIVYSFTYSSDVEDGQPPLPSVCVDVRMQVSPINVAVRREGEPLPEWATEEWYENARKAQNRLIPSPFTYFSDSKDTLLTSNVPSLN